MAVPQIVHYIMRNDFVQSCIILLSEPAEWITHSSKQSLVAVMQQRNVKKIHCKILISKAQTQTNEVIRNNSKPPAVSDCILLQLQ